MLPVHRVGQPGATSSHCLAESFCLPRDVDDVFQDGLPASELFFLAVGVEEDFDDAVQLGAVHDDVPGMST